MLPCAICLGGEFETVRRAGNANAIDVEGSGMMTNGRSSFRNPPHSRQVAQRRRTRRFIVDSYA